MLIEKNNAALLVIDIQEKLIPAVMDSVRLLARCRWLISMAADQPIPIVFSEQYPKGLGHTDPALLALAPNASVMEKMHFSCMAEACLPDALVQCDQVIVCGMEAHVCVLQSVLQLLEQGKMVFVVADAISSRKPDDLALALQRMRDAGAIIVSREMVLFELMRQAGTDHFRAMSKRYLLGE